MGLSKSQRICILLAIDAAFFFLELIVGYAVHSLALVADAFHMLNDVLSLCVGLWAVRVAESGSSNTYTYGWQRAETLGALINGVFLVALCVTIFLEAIQRFVEKPNVSNPKLVLIVGCLGLASNILGLFLFHDHGHGHDHGAEGDEHSHEIDPVRDAEEGHSHTHSHSHSHSHSHDHATERTPLITETNSSGLKSSRKFTSSDEEGTTLTSASTGSPVRKSVSATGEFSRRRRRASSSFGRGFGSIDNMNVHPATFRNEIIQAARLDDVQSESGYEEEEATHENEDVGNGPSEPNGHGHPVFGHFGHHKSVDYSHHDHIHNQPKDQQISGHSHGHSHGDLNMRGVFLHVMGDALGNIGVIATALIIWLTTFEGRFYFDPAISLVITAIILTSAIPLCKAAGRILLQAVPVGLSIDEIRADIESLPRVLEAHHLHVWQLSDTKLVASLHVKVDCDIKGVSSASYMKLAREIRACLHGYGIHSSTIQPEFLSSSPPDVGGHGLAPDGNDTKVTPSPRNASKAASLVSADGRAAGPGCMLDCEDDCGSKGQCCPPSTDTKGQK